MLIRPPTAPRLRPGAALLAIAVCASPPPAAAEAACVPAGQVVAVDGAVARARPGIGPAPLALDQTLCAGDRVITGADGRVELRLVAAETVLGLDANAELHLPGPEARAIAAAAGGGERFRVRLARGVLRFLSSVRSVFEVETRHATAGIDGTEAVIGTGDALTVLAVREGDVLFAPSASGGRATMIGAGEAALVDAGSRAVRPLDAAEAARLPARLARIAVDPEGASDWAIHYPPLALESAAREASIAGALRALAAGDADAAEAALARAGETLDGRAAVDALALGAIVSLARGRSAEGAARAAEAVARDPDAAAAQLALSYAEQGAGRLRAARRAAARAAALAPDDPFAAARLAETSLLIGDRRRAAGEARAALARGETSLAHAVLGLAHLQADRRARARAAFEAGIAADSEDPLPRLGLGLALIRGGAIAEGRREIETAAALSPRRAVFRSWLGRAYAAEGLPEKARAQYDLARDGDPDDALPWLLEAKTLFRQNRIVAALRALGEAEARAPRRATLRDRAGLMEDAATRGAALGRLLEIAGFEDAAVNAAAAAAERDPSNAAAHGVLADLVAKRERQESVSVSAGLASQVWRRPSTEPLDPVRQEARLDLLDAGSATRASLAEFGPYFDGDGARAVVSGTLGTQATRGGQAAGAAMAHGWSAAASVAHHRTDGFAENNDVSHTLLATEIRGQVLPDVTVFGAFGYRRSHYGDRVLPFDLDDVDGDVDERLERHYGRIGASWRIDADHALAGVATITEQAEDRTNGNDFGGFGFEDGEFSGLDGQVQHVGRFGPLSTVSGLAVARVEGAGNAGLDFPGSAFFPGFRFTVPLEQDTRQVTGYAYATLSLGGGAEIAGDAVLPAFEGLRLFGAPVSLDLTAGIAVDRFERQVNDAGRSGSETRFAPKLGLRLDIGERTTLRGAWTQAVAPDPLLPQRLEPQTVAGLAQMTDTRGGALVTTRGGALEIRPAPGVDFGIEGLERRIERAPGEVAAPDGNQSELRLWLDAALGARWTGNVTLTRLTADSAQPGFAELTDYSVGEATAGLRWFHPRGFFAGISAGIAQHRSEGTGGVRRDTFPVGALSLGYRLPGGRGVLALELRNLVDADFGFADRPALPGALTAEPRFAREFTATGRLTLSF